MRLTTAAITIRSVKPKLLTTLKTYSFPDLFADVQAGLTVAMVALPLSIAIAIASGASPAQGLVTAIVGGFLISLLGGSRVQIGGPTGAFIVVVSGVISRHGYDGLVLATLMAGLIMLACGFMRAGSLIALVPEPVVHGFTIGIAIIIAASQLKDFLGMTLAEVPAELPEKLAALWSARDTVSPTAALLAVATLILIPIFRQAAPRLPGLIVAVGIASVLVPLLGLPVDTIGDRFGSLPDRLPFPSIPDLSLERVLVLLPSAITIAFLASIESLLSAMVADRMIGSRHRPNAEVLAQGWANLGSALMGGLPATGAIARTATNVRAGARTPVAGLVHALAILVVMMTLGDLAAHLAMPALAALLMLTAFNMSEPQRWKEHLGLPMPERLVLIVTLALTVATDLTIAIVAGVGLSLLLRRKGEGSALEDGKPPER